jgi:D-serine dehydratase
MDAPLDLAALDWQLLLPGTKGLPLRAPMRQGDVGLQNWSLLNGDLSYPVAVLKQAALDHNGRWMANFVAAAGAALAPHGKTTMSPQLFELQRAAGAWAITVANVTQLLTAHRFGVRRVLLANQPVAPADLDSLFALLRDDAALDVIVLVDSDAGLARLAAAAGRASLPRPLPVMVELGWTGGRTGCRGVDAGLQLARAVAATPGLALCGIEGYEGLLVSGDQEDDARRVRAFLEQMLALLRAVDGEGLLRGDEILLSAGGSAYFDLVGAVFSTLRPLSRPVRRVLRSGCYLTHDHGFYQKLLAGMAARADGCGEHVHRIAADGLQPALEVWAMVQGCPEPDLIMLTLGKRDASYDIDLPLPIAWHRPGSTVSPLPLSGAVIEKMNDQHAYLRMPGAHGLAVGDLVCCGISHPCTTFDKWKTLLTVDDDYRVTGVVNTFF